MTAILVHLRDRGPGEVSAMRSQVLWANAAVVGIEEVLVLGIERPVARQVPLEKERFEEP